MDRVAAARRYARAFFDRVAPQRQVDRAASELQAVLDRARSQPGLRDYLFHPEIPNPDKKRVLAAVLPAELLSETRAFLELLLEHRDLPLLGDIRQALLKLRNERAGVVRARVETARPLSAESRRRIETALERATGRNVVLVTELNPALVAGVRVHVGDRIIDGSVIGRLKAIREEVLAR